MRRSRSYEVNVSYKNLVTGSNDRISCKMEVTNSVPDVQLLVNDLKATSSLAPNVKIVSRDEFMRFILKNPSETDNIVDVQYCFNRLENIDDIRDITKNCATDSQRQSKPNEPVSPLKNEGTWRLVYRGFDRAGNAQQWNSSLIISYVDSSKQKLLSENAKSEKLKFIWDNGSGILSLVKSALSDYSIWNSMATSLEKDISRSNIISSLYAAMIGLHLNGPLISAPTKIDKILLDPAGKFLFAGSDAGIIYKFNVKTRNLVGSVKAHSSGIGDIKLDKMNKNLIIGSFDGTISLIDPDSMQLKKRITCCIGEFPRIAIFNAGEKFAISSWDKTIKLYNFEGELLKTISKESSNDFHSDVIMNIALSDDDRTLYSAGWDKFIKRWNVETGEFLTQSLKPYPDGLESLALYPQQDLIVIGGKEGGLYYEKASTGENLYAMQTGSAVHALSGSKGSTFITGSQDGSIKKWNIETKSVVTAHKVDVFNMGSIASSESGQIFASTSFSPIIRIWDNSGNTDFVSTLILDESENQVRAIEVTDGNKLLAGYSDGHIGVWDLESFTLSKEFKAHDATVYSITNYPEGFFTLSKDGKIRKWNRKFNLVEDFPTITPSEWKYSGAFIRPSNSIMYGTWNGILAQLDLQTRVERELMRTQGWFKIKYLPSIQSILVGDRSRHLRLLGEKDFSVSKSFDIKSEAINAIAFDQSKQRIFSALYNGEISIDDLSQGSEPPIRTGNIIIWDILFDDDSRILLSATNDGHLTLWNTDDKRVIGFPIEAHNKAARSVLVNKQLGQIATASDDGSVKIWSIPLTRDPQVIYQAICKEIKPFLNEQWFQKTLEPGQVVKCAE